MVQAGGYRLGPVHKECKHLIACRLLRPQNRLQHAEGTQAHLARTEAGMAVRLKRINRDRDGGSCKCRDRCTDRGFFDATYRKQV